MSGICGWIGELNAASSGDDVVHAMARVLSRFDGASTSTQRGQRYGLAASGVTGRASSAAMHGCAAVIWGTPGFCDEDLEQIARTAGLAAATIAAFRKHGPKTCEKLSGPFALAVVCESSGEALLAVDRMGIGNIVYAEISGGLAFGASADAVNQHPGVQPAVDWQSLYHYVHFHMVPGPATAFREQNRILPGQFLHWRDGALKLGWYWQMQFVENEERPFPELRETFLSTIRDSVRRMSSAGPTGAFLSGGTDSSTISGMLGEVTGKPADTFSIGFSEPGYDEMAYASIAARHFKTAQHAYYVTPADIVDAIPRLAEIYDQPFGNSSAVPTYCCARFARESGMTILLGGDGGDELFGGNERYATHYRYSLYGKLPQPLRRNLLEPLAVAMPGGGVFPPIRWYRRLIELASMPMPDRMDAHNLLVRFGPQNVFTPELLAQIDLEGPQRLMREVYDGANAVSLINKMLAYDFRFTLTDSDLPKVMKSCELAGLPVEFPMLDDRLVSFSARLAPQLKLKGTRLRYFFKEALRGFLPDEIITKTKHGFGLPFGPWLRSHPPLHELVMDSLAKLRTRDFIQAPFIDRLMQTHLAEHPSYYGTMAWVLMMLELWFERHASPAR